jgi:hypothetical protein
MNESLTENLQRLKIFVIYFSFICGAAYVSSLHAVQKAEPLHENIYFSEMIKNIC